jgi:hypothetical protein
MMGTYVVTIALLFGLMAMLIGVERFYRWFAARHPECGPYRTKSIGCQKCEKKGSNCEEPRDSDTVAVH